MGSARDERGAARRAALLAVGIGEQHPFCGDAVDVGRSVPHHAAAVAREIPNADVVTQMTRMLGLVDSAIAVSFETI
jgi:hypothetical protein